MQTHRRLKLIDFAGNVFLGRKLNENDMPKAKIILEKLKEIEKEDEEACKGQSELQMKTLAEIAGTVNPLKKDFQETNFYKEKYALLSKRLRPRIEEYFIKRMRDDILLKTENYHWLTEEFAFDGIANLLRHSTGRLVPAHFAKYFRKFIQGQEDLFFEIFEPALIVSATSEVLYYTVNEKFITYHENRKFEGCGDLAIDSAIQEKINAMALAY